MRACTPSIFSVFFIPYDRFNDLRTARTKLAQSRLNRANELYFRQELARDGMGDFSDNDGKKALALMRGAVEARGRFWLLWNQFKKSLFY